MCEVCQYEYAEDHNQAEGPLCRECGRFRVGSDAFSDRDACYPLLRRWVRPGAMPPLPMTSRSTRQPGAQRSGATMCRRTARRSSTTRPCRYRRACRSQPVGGGSRAHRATSADPTVEEHARSRTGDQGASCGTCDPRLHVAAGSLRRGNRGARPAGRPAARAWNSVDTAKQLLYTTGHGKESTASLDASIEAVAERRDDRFPSEAGGSCGPGRDGA